MPTVLTKTIAKTALMFAAIATLPGAQSRLGSFELRVLESHNRERLIMRVPPLRWNANLAAGAQQWANHLARTGKFEHSPNVPGRPQEGENIWGGTSGAFDPEDMVNLWIDEKRAFVPGTFPANSKTGRVQDVSHYTQLVWKDTQKVGCAIAQGGNEEIMVCRYSHAGNVIGRRVLKSRSNI